MNVTKQRIKKNLTLFIFIFLAGNFGYAQLPDPLPSPIQSGAYFPGLIGARDYANPGISGIAVIDYNIYFNADKYFDRNGNAVNSIDFVPNLGEIPIDIDISGYLNALAIAYVSPELPFLGGPRYIGAIAPYFATANFQAAFSELGEGGTIEGGSSGIGDLAVIPLLLSWAAENEKYDITTGYMFVAPTGRFETGAADNVGLGYWSHLVQLFTYYYPLPQKATAIYLGHTFEIHSKFKDVDVTAGSRYTLEYGVSQYLSPRFEITVQGGNVWQVGEDSGNDVYWDTSVKDRTSTIGVGVGFWPVPKKFYSNLKWFTSYGQRQHFNINVFELELVYLPWIKSEKTEN